MYEVINENYPKLETYQCYECGFHADTILMQQRGLYQSYQSLFMHSKEKGLVKLKLLPKRPTDESLQPNEDNHSRRRLDSTLLGALLNYRLMAMITQPVKSRLMEL
jgi:hypothetical protein